ncbi:MAG TPA: GNAT family N-acetyltransferase [Chthoniobacterales bacterium]|nr:GNAT family N-acetyltransferase [Chthoniobacterales bacterium]
MSVASSDHRRSETGATDIRVRDARNVDLAAITDIYNAAIATRSATAQLEPVTIDECRGWVSGGYPLWVAEIDGCVAGWLSCKPFLPRCAYRGTVELSVYVDRSFRRRGVARRLLQHAIARGPALGISAMVGLIFEDNAPSLRLFQRLGFARWGVLPRVARVEAAERDLVIVGHHCDARHIDAPVNDAEAQLHEAFELMHSLMQYRQQPIHGELDNVRKKYSMLHLDVLLLIYHFAKIGSGQILEIGAYLGGATIAAARGVRDSGKQKTVIAVEQGGSLKHERLGTRNILRDLERNLAKARVADLVRLIKGRSCDTATVAAVEQALGPDKICLLILDADAAKQRDIDCYRAKLATGCWMVIDDYYGPVEKIAAARADVDSLTAAGWLEPLGFYGWSTWVGRWRGTES